MSCAQTIDDEDDSAQVGRELDHLLHDKLAHGQDLLRSLGSQDLKSVQGLAKLEKKIRQELKFLQKFRSTEDKKRRQQQQQELKKEHLNCSNLHHLSAIVRVLLDSKEPSSVLQSFSLQQQQQQINEDPEDDDCEDTDQSSSKKVVVDVVSESGLVWSKVIARNPKSLDLNVCGGNQFGQRSLMDQVKEFLACARQNPKMFRIPRVVFVFHNGVSERLAERLRRKGLVVEGKLIPSHVENDVESSSDEEEEEATEEEDSDEEEGQDESQVSVSDEGDHPSAFLSGDLDSSSLNLDITAMIAYVSALTNGHAEHSFQEPILSEQASWERERPVKPFLDDLFRGKRLVCCRSAMDDFRSILETLGGPGERARAEELLARVEVVQDRTSERLSQLDVSGKIKERSRAIFGTGDSLRIVTVSANSGFVRAAKGQGVELAVILHESRALTEDKMKKKKKQEQQDLRDCCGGANED